MWRISYSSHRGFTLLELMVATSIGVLVLIGIVRIFEAVLSHSNRSIGQLSRTAGYLSAMDVFESDVQSLVWELGNSGFVKLHRPEGNDSDKRWVSVEQDLKPNMVQVSMMPNTLGHFAEERWGRTGAVIKLFVNGSSSGRLDPGGVYAVSYQIVRISDNGLSGSSKYCLMRSRVSARNTFSTGYQFGESAYEDIQLASSSAYWAPSVISMPNSSHVLLDHVIDFGIRAYSDSDGGEGSRLVFPRSEPITVLAHKPTRIAIMIRVLTEEGAVAINNMEQNRLRGDWWDVAIRHSQVFVRTVEIP